MQQHEESLWKQSSVKRVFYLTSFVFYYGKFAQTVTPQVFQCYNMYILFSFLFISVRRGLCNNTRKVYENKVQLKEYFI